MAAGAVSLLKDSRPVWRPCATRAQDGAEAILSSLVVPQYVKYYEQVLGAN